MYEVTARPAVARDRGFCSSARKTAAQTCRSIAEGFGRYGHTQFAQHIDVALASLHETKDHLDEALQAGHVVAEEYASLDDLAEHARACGLRLLRHLSPDHQELKSGRRSHRPAKRRA